MAETKPDSRQIKKRQALPKLGTVANASVETVLDQINTEVDSPLRMYASTTPDAQLNFASSQINAADSAKKVVSPVKKQIFNSLSSPFINFQTGAVSNAADFDISIPAGTVGYFRNVGFTLIGSGKIKALFSAEVATEGALSNAGALFVAGGLPIGYVTLECTNVSGQYKTAGSVTNVIESAKIFRFGSGAGGSSSSASGGAGGGELADLMYQAAIRDSFADIPDGNTTVDIASGKTDSTLHDVANELFRINYDASNTVTGTGTSMTLSGTPSFTIKEGDILVVNSEARRISSITSQTVFTIESAFTVDPSAAAACVSQAIHTVDLNAFTAGGTGLAASSQFSSDIDELLVGYEDSETASDIIPDFGSAARIAYSASADGSSWSGTRIRETSLSTETSYVATPTSGTNLYLRFFANKTSGTGAVNLLSYKVFFHKQTGETVGAIYRTAFARPTSSIYQNCSHSVVGGKSRLQFTFSYPRGLNSTEAAGSAIEVIINGQSIPRFVAGVTDTTQAYFTELGDNLIELDTDYSATGLGIQVKLKQFIIDTNTQNTSRLTDLETYMTDLSDLDRVGLATVAVPNTTIVNRAQVVDMSGDLSTDFGINRIMTQSIYEIQNEFGANGERVFGVVGDLFNQTRLVGSWVNATNISGQGVQSSTTNDYMEVTFYGTGLNLVFETYSVADDLRVSVDGGAEGANLFVGTTYSNILNNRNYSTNNVIVLASGLSLGLHTVKLRKNAAVLTYIYGFEVLTNSTSLNHIAGSYFTKGKKVTSVASTSTYNNSFESGTLATKGGRVLVYQKSDGTIAKAVRPTDTTALYLTNAVHTNEEVFRIHNYREFSAGRADDFSDVAATSNRSFVLDDGTTTLVGVNVLRSVQNGIDSIATQVLNAYLTITFVGTGLDIIVNGNSGQTDTCSVTIDNVNQGNITLNKIGQLKIASGLPYGTHTVKFLRNVQAAGQGFFTSFVIYQPKKPTLPANSSELSEYFIPANFVANATSGLETISTGAVRKQNIREWTFVNGTGGTTDWTVDTDFNSNIIGLNLRTNRTNAYAQLPFFGTGFDFRFQIGAGGATSTTVTLNGTTLTAANFPSATFSVYGTGATFNSGTGVLDMQDAATSIGGLVVSGLPLSQYVFKVTNNGTANMSVSCLDVIAPTYSTKSMIPFDLQNTLVVGGTTNIGDLRKIQRNVVKLKKVIQVNQITPSPSTTSGSNVPLTDMSATYLSEGEWVNIEFQASMKVNAAAQAYSLQIYVDGIALAPAASGHGLNASLNIQTYISKKVYLSPGAHKIDIYWSVSGGATANAEARQLMITQL